MDAIDYNGYDAWNAAFCAEVHRITGHRADELFPDVDFLAEFEAFDGSEFNAKSAAIDVCENWEDLV